MLDKKSYYFLFICPFVSISSAIVRSGVLNEITDEDIIVRSVTADYSGSRSSEDIIRDVRPVYDEEIVPIIIKIQQEQPTPIISTTTTSTVTGVESGEDEAETTEIALIEESQKTSPAPHKPTYPNITAFFRRLREIGYDARLRPYLNVKPVVVTCSLFISAISRISETEMDYTADFYFRQTWTDYRIRWDASHHDDDNPEEAITISAPEYFPSLWRPDSFFVNEKTAFSHHVTTTNAYIKIDPDGHVTQTVRLTIRAFCHMNFRYFPLDHQRCPLLIESFAQPVTELEYKWFRTKPETEVNDEAAAFSPEATSLVHFVVHGFRTLDLWMIREDDGFNHSRLEFDIYLARSLGYYLIQIYIPASLIVVISWIAFWVPRNSPPARVSLGVTTVLTMVTFTSMGFKAGLPNISYLKAMDIYLVISFIMVFAALLEYAAVTYLEKKAKSSSTLGKLLLATTSVETRRKKPGQEDEEPFHCYVALEVPSRIEWICRFTFPLVYLVFNCIYWNYFLNNSLDDIENDAGFVDFNLD